MKKQFILFFLLLLFFACTQREQTTQDYTSNVVEAKGNVLPDTSVIKPEIILAGKPTVVIAGKPKLVITNSNKHEVREPIILLAGLPEVYTPGKSSFSLPETVLAIDSVFEAGSPDVLNAKDPFKRDQTVENFSNFGVLQGLINNSVYCMIQDKNGNLWFGTMHGVSKYDGKSFFNYTTTQGLNNNSVMSILEDKKGNIWFGTQNGLSKYDGKSFTSFSNFKGFDNSILSLIEDDAGNIWMGTFFNGVIKYDGKYFTHYTNKNGLIWNAISTIVQDKKGNIWIGTNSGISKYDGSTFTNYTEKQGMKSSWVTSMYEDKNENLWIGTAKGLQKFNGRYFMSIEEKNEYLDKTINSTWSDPSWVSAIFQDKHENLWFSFHGMGICKYDGKYFTHFTVKHGLCSNLIELIFQDNNGNLWFASPTEGLSKYEVNSFTFPLETNLLDNNPASAILQDKSGNYWIGTGYHSEGVYMYDGKKIAKFTEAEGLINNSVETIWEDETGNIWFGTLEGISIYNGRTFTNFSEKQGLSNTDIVSIVEDKNKNFWFGTAGGGVIKYDGKWFTNYNEKQGLCSNNIRTMIRDKKGNLWIGSNDGLSKYDGKSFTNYTNKGGLSCMAIWSILEDKLGNIWLGTYSGGVYKYDGKFFTQYTKNDGLSDNIVVSILEDKQSNIWFGTEFGLSKLSSKNFAKLAWAHQAQPFEKYTFEDGFLGSTCMPNAIYEDKDGTIWIGTWEKLTTYHKDRDIPDTLVPNIHLTNIQLFNENISWSNLEAKKDTCLILKNGTKISNLEFDGISKWYLLPENLSLAYDNNYITFCFVGITQTKPNKVKYQFRLDGIEGGWSSVTNRTEASYINLPQGTYTFKVKAMNSDGYWSSEYNYIFSIRPPWWKTWWAYNLYFFSLLGTIWYYIKWREKSLRQRQNELEQTVMERTSELVIEKKEVEKQKGIIEELLANILPKEVAEELKQNGSVEAKQFEEVTVMFTDFKGFTQIAEKLSAVDLVTQIHTCFKAFDNITTKHGIEKIKTIGDSYMCVGGLPIENKSHAIDVVMAALEIRHFMQTYLQDSKTENKEVFEIRIGIHTGSVVAGIVGVKKFAYDIWGDTVNIASRMESNSESGKINISRTTYELVKNKFTCIHRGKIHAKNKGEVDMYFVESVL